MTETEQNRRWLLANRVTPRPATTAEAPGAQALEYYCEQLERELEHVRAQLAGIGKTMTPQT